MNKSPLDHCIHQKEIWEYLMDDPMCRLTMKLLDLYDKRYIGNVPIEKARELGVFDVKQ